MTSHPSARPVSALRARMIEDMRVRGFSEKTRNDYIRNVRAFAAFVGRSPDTATAEDLRRFQHHQAQTGVRPPSINSAVAALRFFFTVTLDRPDLARRLTIVREPRRLPAEGPRRRDAFAAHLVPLKRKKWFVWAKPPFSGPEAVLAYLARYTHRVAIANSRLIALEERGVTFRYKDYRRNGQARYRTMTLSADEFIRRFLLHVLPKGLHRIRHYGLLASASCQHRAR